MHLQIVAPAGGTAAGCFRLRHSGGFFGEPIWLVVNSDPALPPYAGDAGAAAAAATLQPQQMEQQQMLAMQQQQQGMFGQVQPHAPAEAAAATGPSGRLFQQAAAGAGLGAQAAGAPAPGGMALDEDDMDL